MWFMAMLMMFVLKYLQTTVREFDGKESQSCTISLDKRSSVARFVRIDESSTALATTLV